MSRPCAAKNLIIGLCVERILKKVSVLSENKNKTECLYQNSVSVSVCVLCRIDKTQVTGGATTAEKLRGPPWFGSCDGGDLVQMVEKVFR